MSECAAESLVGEEGEAVVEVRDGDVTQHFVDEGVLQEQACFRFGNSALTHIKQSSLVQLSGCGAVVTTYVVGIDFQHGLRESARGRRGTKAGSHKNMVYRTISFKCDQLCRLLTFILHIFYFSNGNNART